VPAEVEPALAARVREVSLASLGSIVDGADDGSDEPWRALEPLLEGKSAIAFGPGVGRRPAMRRLLEQLLAAWQGPLVIDADGLNLLSENVAILDGTRAQVVLTPHPAEMGRLAGITTAEVQADRILVARQFAVAHHCVVVLKGARTVIADADRLAINPTGNPGMASGGTGDALTGVVAALLAAGAEPFVAASSGAYLHGRAGDLARDAIGEIGLVASDLIARLPTARRGQRGG